MNSALFAHNILLTELNEIPKIFTQKKKQNISKNPEQLYLIKSRFPLADVDLPSCPERASQSSRAFFNQFRSTLESFELAGDSKPAN